MDIEEEITALRAATREAHEAMKDLKGVVKQAKEERDALILLFAAVADGLISKHLDVQFEKLNPELDRIMDTISDSLNKRFDHIADVFLGVDEESKAKGELTLEEMALAIKLVKESS